MTYSVSYCNKSFEVSARVDAKRETVVKKIVQECMRQTGLDKCQYWVDYPNVWTNGAVGTLCVNGNFVGVSKSGCEASIFLG